jgi:hypothetical protein
VKNQILLDAIQAGLAGPLDILSDHYMERLEKYAAIVQTRAIRLEIGDRLSYHLGYCDGKRMDLFYSLVMKKISRLINEKPKDSSPDMLLLSAVSDIVHDHWISHLEPK